MTQSVNIPGYKIEKVLGVGGMSTVYLATQESLGRKVALKVMSADLGQDPTYTRRFLKEAQIIAQLAYTHIVVIYDYGFVNGHHFIVMEYIQGGDLFRKVNKGISTNLAVNVLTQTAKALRYAHRNGFVHRDIKPGNILFRPDGSVVLSDFGLAKGLSDVTQVTVTGVTMGTPAYMSPEQAFGDNVDARSDVYSLGCVFYYMLTGQKMFTAENAIAMAMKHLKEEIPRLKGDLAIFQPILEGCVAKKPNDRFQSADELLAAIAGIDECDQDTEVLDYNVAREAADFEPPARQTKVSEPTRTPHGIEVVDAVDYQPVPVKSEPVIEAGADSKPDLKSADFQLEESPADLMDEYSGAYDKFERSIFQKFSDKKSAESLSGSHPIPPKPQQVQVPTAQPQSVDNENLALYSTPNNIPPSGVISAGESDEEPRSRTWFFVIFGVVGLVISMIVNVLLGLYLAYNDTVPKVSEAEVVAAYEQSQWTEPSVNLTEFADNLAMGGQGPDMVVVPPGEFQMGDTTGRYGASALPVRTVYVPRSFAISKTEVTFDSYKKFASATGREVPSDRGWGMGDRPAIYVSWNDAKAFTDWLSEQTGKRYRLPSEAEWEYAGRSGSSEDYWWGVRPSHQFANYGSEICCRGEAKGNDRWVDQTAPVASLTPNKFGLFDTSGNVWEWVEDCWNIDHYAAPDNPKARLDGDCSKRVVKGGSWSDIPRNIASAARGRTSPDSKFGFIGFRVVREQ